MRKTKNLVSQKSYRFPPMLAFQVSLTARNHDLTESEFVRKVLMDAVDDKLVDPIRKSDY